MRRILALPFLVLLLAALALACGGSSTPTATEATIEDVSDAELQAAFAMPGLTDEQRAAVEAAFAAARQRILDLRARHVAGEVTAAEAMAIARQIHAELQAALASILTPEQLERLRHPGPPPIPGLTQEQLAQMAALRHALGAYARELQARVHSGEITPEAAREALRVRAHETLRQICAILTTEQRARLPFCAGG